MNVNLDVLELIFAELRGGDLVAVAQVSRAFLAGAIPTLYAAIDYSIRHLKRAHFEASPFATLVAHPHLAVHVRRIALYAAPAAHHAPALIDPAFLHDLARALHAATNIRAFVCTPKILPPLIPHILDKPRLHHLRINAPIASRQLALLVNCTTLHSLALDFPSWHVIDALPNWSASMQKTLVHLSISLAQDLDPNVLHATLSRLPRLRGLHLVSCPRITHTVVLSLIALTPDLRELSFSIFPSQETALPPMNFPIPPLTHLAIDVRASHPGLAPLLARIITRLSPRDALAICGGWIGEIKTAAERVDSPPDVPGPAPGAGPNHPQNFPIYHGHFHIPPAPANNHHANDPPLLSPAVSHDGNVLPNPNPPIPAPAPPSTVFGFSFPLGNLLNGNGGNGNGDPPGGPPDPPDPGFPSDSRSLSLISSFPSTLSVLHIPQISPAALKEVLDRCEGIRVLGVVMGRGFASSTSTKFGKSTSRVTARSKGRGPTAKPAIDILAGILSRATTLRELIIDTSPADTNNNAHGLGPRHNGGSTLLTPHDVRVLMQTSPLLRRIVGEGRVWESPTPTPSSPVPFPDHITIDLKFSRARPGPGTVSGHGHSPPGFGTHGGGYSQMEASNEHWFWLAGSGSGGAYSGF